MRIVAREVFYQKTDNIDFSYSVSVYRSAALVVHEKLIRAELELARELTWDEHRRRRKEGPIEVVGAVQGVQEQAGVAGAIARRAGPFKDDNA